MLGEARACGNRCGFGQDGLGVLQPLEIAPEAGERGDGLDRAGGIFEHRIAGGFEIAADIGVGEQRDA